MLPCSSGVCTPDQGSGASACLDTGGRGACPPGEAAQREDRKQQGPGAAHVPGEGLAKTGLQHRGQQGMGLPICSCLGWPQAFIPGAVRSAARTWAASKAGQAAGCPPADVREVGAGRLGQALLGPRSSRWTPGMYLEGSRSPSPRTQLGPKQERARHAGCQRGLGQLHTCPRAPAPL